MGIPTLTGREFATKFALRPGNYAWFLGAGASASGRIPTGDAMIRDFKTEIFCRATGVPRREVDSTDPLWVARIATYFEKHAILPPPGDPTEYARAFEAVYPTPAERRLYIDSQVNLGRPSYAHRVLASLLATGRTPCAFTTNFDDLIETATTIARELLPTQDRKSLTVAAIDDAERAQRCIRENDWPLLAKIHGDFRSEELKNTETELQVADERMRGVLSEACRRFALVVVGYSGRDKSVMDVLNQALEQDGAFPGGIYWMARDPSGLLPTVIEFLDRAGGCGKSAHIIHSQNFDEFAGDIADAIRFSEPLAGHIQGAQPEPILRLSSLPSFEARRDPVLRCSAIRITTMPTVARRVVLARDVEIAEVRAKLKEHKAKATVAAAGRHWAAFGVDADIVSALAEFQPRLEGTIELNPTQDSWALGLVYDALAKALCKARPLRPRLKRSGHSIIISSGSQNETDEHRVRRLRELGPLKTAYGADLFGRVQGLGYPFAEAIQVRLEEMNGAWWCVFDPFTQVDIPMNAEGACVSSIHFQKQTNPAADWIRERWARRYNRNWVAIIDAWSSILSGEVQAFWCEPDQGINATFNVGAISAWSLPSHDHPYFHRQSR